MQHTDHGNHLADFNSPPLKIQVIFLLPTC